jgi:hypothetical protein
MISLWGMASAGGFGLRLPIGSVSMTGMRGGLILLHILIIMNIINLRSKTVRQRMIQAVEVSTIGHTSAC